MFFACPYDSADSTYKRWHFRLCIHRRIPLPLINVSRSLARLLVKIAACASMCNSLSIRQRRLADTYIYVYTDRPGETLYILLYTLSIQRLYSHVIIRLYMQSCGCLPLQNLVNSMFVDDGFSLTCVYSYSMRSSWLLSKYISYSMHSSWLPSKHIW